MSLPEVARMQSQERRSGTHGRRMRENRAGGACDSHCAGPLPQGPGLLSPIVSAQGEARAFPGRIGAQRVPREIRKSDKRYKRRLSPSHGASANSYDMARSAEHTSELQSLMRNSSAVF